ncbi:MAG TPA: aminotransferase class I/II-fold pyridoxal phosphate-dependent enzyme [Bdellovibrionota bacterium]|nr:aminotransferase class I/II-fold pyridoxal phosphate-dependent enzyme [Bdellovibrionota bacterium]
MDSTDSGFSTLSNHADRPLNASNSVAPPIYQTANFAAASAEEFLAAATEPRHSCFYTRYANPTHAQAEAVIAALEETESSLLLGSGMAAISTTILSFVSRGEHVVAQKNHYAGSLSFLRDFAPRFGIETTFVDPTRFEEFERALRPETRLILLETPSNPTAQVTDLAAVARLARARGIVTAVDNTFATPINQRPIGLGCDLCLHSATKYLGGHSDLVMGAVAGSRALVEKVWKNSILLGASVNALDSWLLLRGLRTLPLRVKAHNANALAVAKFLSVHPKIERVHYAGLESHPQHALARAQMSGFGGTLSFELKAGYDGAEKLISKLRLARRAASLGGVESLVSHIPAMWAKSATAEQLREMGIAPGLVRLSTGIEDEQDLLKDLDQAL